MGAASPVGAGRSREVVATLRALAQGQPEGAEVWVEIAFLEKHEPHMRYDWLKYRGRPLGSGAIKSAMRRVINPPPQGQWDLLARGENVEGMLVLRAAVLTGRWQEMMGAAHVLMRLDRRRDLAVACTGHGGGVECRSSGQAIGAATCLLRPGYPPKKKKKKKNLDPCHSSVWTVAIGQLARRTTFCNVWPSECSTTVRRTCPLSPRPPRRSAGDRTPNCHGRGVGWPGGAAGRRDRDAGRLFFPAFWYISSASRTRSSSGSRSRFRKAASWRRCRRLGEL